MALPFLRDIVLGFGHDECLPSQSCQSIPEWRPMFDRSFVSTFCQGAQSPLETRGDLSAVI